MENFKKSFFLANAEEESERKKKEQEDKKWRESKARRDALADMQWAEFFSGWDMGWFEIEIYETLKVAELSSSKIVSVEVC